jgi:hypothetical protein
VSNVMDSTLDYAKYRMEICTQNFEKDLKCFLYYRVAPLSIMFVVSALLLFLV